MFPISLDAASRFIAQYHRHHKPPRGHKFSLGCDRGDGWLLGVAVVGRPVSRRLDDGATLEVTRLATDGTRNVCSKLYAAAARGARAIGARRVVTYTHETESGASLRGAGWIITRRNPGRKQGWGRASRPRRPSPFDGVARLRWEAPLQGQDGPQ